MKLSGCSVINVKRRGGGGDKEGKSGPKKGSSKGDYLPWPLVEIHFRSPRTNCEFWPWAKFLFAVNKLMGDTLKWVGFKGINVCCGNLSSGQIPTEVLRHRMREEMDRSFNFFKILITP